MEKYDEKSADKMLAKLIDDGPDWFCPLVRGDCVENCVSFNPPRKDVVADRYQEGVHYNVFPGYCSNMLMGG